MFQKIKGLLFRNITGRQTVAKNTFWLTVSNLGGRLLRAVVIIYAARILGAAGWGEFSYTITLVAFLTIFIDFGINAVLIRESSKNITEEERLKTLSTSFFIKSLLLTLGVLIVIFAAPYFVTLPGAKALLPIVSLILIFDTLREFGFSLIRALEKMEWEAAIFLLTNAGIVVFGLVFLRLAPTAKSFAWGYVAGTALGVAATFYALRKYFSGIVSFFSKDLVKPILRTAWPFAITGALGVFLTNTDILIIGWLKSAADVGFYSAAIRIIQLLYLLPSVLQVSTLPLLSRLANTDNVKFRRVLESMISLVFLASIPLAIGGFILGDEIIKLLFGSAYLPGALSFKILMLTMIIDFPAVVISGAIFTYNHQKSLIVSAALGGGFNVLFDLLLIPPFGIVGSAFATLFAQFIINVYLWHIMKKINFFEILPRLKKIIIAAFIMGGATLALLLENVPLVLNITICIAFYFLLLKVLREPLVKEIREIVSPLRENNTETVAA